MVPIARNAYSVFEDGAAWSDATGLKCEDPSLASQEAYIDTDINRIVETWVKTGIAPMNPIQALQGDFTDAVDFRTSLDRIRAAQAEFNALDANVRSYFANDPANMIDFLQNPDNRAKAEELGLVIKAPLAQPSPADPGAQG